MTKKTSSDVANIPIPPMQNCSSVAVVTMFEGFAVLLDKHLEIQQLNSLFLSDLQKESRQDDRHQEPRRLLSALGLWFLSGRPVVARVPLRSEVL